MLLRYSSPDSRSFTLALIDVSWVSEFLGNLDHPSRLTVPVTRDYQSSATKLFAAKQALKSLAMSVVPQDHILSFS